MTNFARARVLLQLRDSLLYTSYTTRQSAAEQRDARAIRACSKLLEDMKSRSLSLRIYLACGATVRRMGRTLRNWRI